MVIHPRYFPSFFVFKASSSSHHHILWRELRFLYFCLVLTFFCFFFYLCKRDTSVYASSSGCNTAVVYMSDSVCSSDCVVYPRSLRSFCSSDELSPNLFSNLQKLLKSLSVSEHFHLELQIQTRGGGLKWMCMSKFFYPVHHFSSPYWVYTYISPCSTTTLYSLHPLPSVQPHIDPLLDLLIISILL